MLLPSLPRCSTRKLILLLTTGGTVILLKLLTNHPPNMRMFAEVPPAGIRIHSSCLALLQSGKLSEKSIWRPNGCVMHIYTKSQLISCFERRRRDNVGNLYVFNGDSRVRNLARTFMELSGFPVSEGLRFRNRHPNVSEMEVRHITDVFLGSAASRVEKLAPERPALVLGGDGLWYAADGALPTDIIMWNMTLAEKRKIYRAKVRAWARNASALAIKSPTTRVVWMIQEPVDESGPPYYNITNDKMADLNTIAEETLRNFPNILVWSSIRQLNLEYQAAGLRVFDRPDLVHTNKAVMKVQIQMIFNLMCNEFSSDAHPNVCCKSS